MAKKTKRGKILRKKGEFDLWIEKDKNRNSERQITMNLSKHLSMTAKIVTP